MKGSLSSEADSSVADLSVADLSVADLSVADLSACPPPDADGASVSCASASDSEAGGSASESSPGVSYDGVGSEAPVSAGASVVPASVAGAASAVPISSNDAGRVPSSTICSSLSIFRITARRSVARRIWAILSRVVSSFRRGCGLFLTSSSASPATVSRRSRSASSKRSASSAYWVRVASATPSSASPPSEWTTSRFRRCSASPTRNSCRSYPLRTTCRTSSSTPAVFCVATWSVRSK